MHNTNNTKIFKTIVQNNVYIINKISFQIDDTILSTIFINDTNELIEIISSTLSTMTKHSKNDYKNFIEKFIVFDFIKLKFIVFVFVEFNLKSTINENISSKKRNLFIFWHRRLNHLNSAKLKKLHKIITLKKSIFIVENHDSCEICALIKMINKRNHRVFERKH